jgi:hypothetical protein
MENYKREINNLAEEMLTILHDSAEWVISDNDAEGDDFNAIHTAVCKQVIKKMLDTSTGIKTYDRI